jgi:hypothetical protein
MPPELSVWAMLEHCLSVFQGQGQVTLRLLVEWCFDGFGGAMLVLAVKLSYTLPSSDKTV